jgi:hypothetical protein
MSYYVLNMNIFFNFVNLKLFVTIDYFKYENLLIIMIVGFRD